jgi:putative phosphoribosyl transferase
MKLGHADDLVLPFRDRSDAGRMLAAALRAYRGHPDTVVLGLPRGGVVPAAEIAHALGLPLDVIVVRKLRAPGSPEHAIGAVAEDEEPWLAEQTMRRAGASREYLAQELARQRDEIVRRRRCFRGGRSLSLPERATVILVDDGAATGSTVVAAIRALRRHGIARLVLAIPVAPRHTAAALRGLVDELIVLATPRRLHSVGFFYDEFAAVADEDVIALLRAQSSEASRVRQSGDALHVSA